MKAGLPELEPKLLARWREIGLYDELRAALARAPEVRAPRRAALRQRPHPHRARAEQDPEGPRREEPADAGPRQPLRAGLGLPRAPDRVEDRGAIPRQGPQQGRRCRSTSSAANAASSPRSGSSVQREEFKRLGVLGDWERPYSTMSFRAEATIARELMKFAKSGLLYRGSKPVMWSVVEKTALAEAEVEYQDYTSDQIWVKFPIEIGKAETYVRGPSTRDTQRRLGLQSTLDGACVVIWTTTPWTIPGNRAVSYSSKIEYGLYEVTAAPDGNWAKIGDRFVLADKLAADVMKAAKVDMYEPREAIAGEELSQFVCAHPLAALGYDFAVPLLDGDHVTDDTGTGFVHTAPGHGADDYNIWIANQKALHDRGIDTTIPFTVDADGVFTKDAPGFEGKRVLDGDRRQGRRQRRRHQGADRCRQTSSRAGASSTSIRTPGARRSRSSSATRRSGSSPSTSRSISRCPTMARRSPSPRSPPMGATITGRATGRRCARLALAEIRQTEWVPDDRREPHHRHDREPTRLGGLAPARLGRADHRLPQHGDRRRDPRPGLRRLERALGAHRPGLRREGRRRLVRGRAPRSASSQGSSPTTISPSGSRSRDVLDVWFDSGSTHAFTLEDPEQFPVALRHLSPPRRRRRPHHVPRRLGPAPRLVPLVAARELRHARICAL